MTPERISAILESLPNKGMRKKAKIILQENMGNLWVNDDGMVRYPDGSGGSSIRDLLLALLTSKGERESIPPDFDRFVSYAKGVNDSIYIYFELPSNWILYREKKH